MAVDTQADIEGVCYTLNESDLASLDHSASTYFTDLKSNIEKLEGYGDKLIEGTREEVCSTCQNFRAVFDSLSESTV